eukprot:TRINITY_DN12033_c0_g1_i1.p1 TRINITY_DN12033_c0_g1~~TRINITY_DN12033_c0_g1_i1.p1  ORF type:complete len:269 (-),score=72.47 TRINITY_DN12033_c0_g1_i1:84-890(-)
MTDSYAEYLEFALSLAKEAGAVIKEAFYREKQGLVFKDAVDLVTATDKHVEEFVMSKIRERYPDHLFVAEESAAAGHLEEVLTEKPTWIIDPIDGTTNFVHRFPMTCISIGFAINKIVVAGVVFNPIIDELFSAVRGGGAFLNGKRISVSDRSLLKHALVATGFPYDRDDATLDAALARLKKVLQACRAVRRGGSAAIDMCYVAAGITDLYFEKGIHAWDIAAGMLLVEEAGGVVMSLDGSEFDMCNRQVVACSKVLEEQVKELLYKQ